MSILILLHILLIGLVVCIIWSQNNLKSVIFYSAFSLITACLYYFLLAPDLALAEAAIGSAIIPLVYIIAISKQRTFLVVCHLKDDDPFLYYNTHTNKKGQGYKLLQQFTKYYDLKLIINKGSYDELSGVFRVLNIDLVIEKCSDTKQYILKGKKTSILMNKLEELTSDVDQVRIVKVEDGHKGEQDD